MDKFRTEDLRRLQQAADERDSLGDFGEESWEEVAAIEGVVDQMLAGQDVSDEERDVWVQKIMDVFIPDPRGGADVLGESQEGSIIEASQNRKNLIRKFHKKAGKKDRIRSRARKRLLSEFVKIAK